MQLFRFGTEQQSSQSQVVNHVLGLKCVQYANPTADAFFKTA